MVTDGADDYILSNNHVLARTNKADIGETIIHPGLIDQNPVCSKDQGDQVAALADFVPISFDADNEVDAAIAIITDTSIVISNPADPRFLIDIKSINPSPTTVAVGHEVQKDGRTSGHTTGTVAAVDVTVNVGYPNKCGGRSGKIATFVNQFRISDGNFSTGGDSGALILDTTSNPPRPGRSSVRGELHQYCRQPHRPRFRLPRGID